jgi:hypothetical protein
MIKNFNSLLNFIVMEIIEISILDPKVKKLLNDLADMELIQLSKPYKLSATQKKNILIGKNEIKNKKTKTHVRVMRNLESWLKEK